MSKKKKRITESSGNVFVDMGFEQAEAENLLIRSKLMSAIKTYIDSEGITQSEAAEQFKVAYPESVRSTREKLNYFQSIN